MAYPYAGFVFWKFKNQNPHKYNFSLIYFSDLKIYSGFPYQFSDFLDIREFLTNFGNSGFWKFIGDFLTNFSTFWIYGNSLPILAIPDFENLWGWKHTLVLLVFRWAYIYSGFPSLNRPLPLPSHASTTRAKGYLSWSRMMMEIMTLSFERYRNLGIFERIPKATPFNFFQTGCLKIIIYFLFILLKVLN